MLLKFLRNARTIFGIFGGKFWGSARTDSLKFGKKLELILEYIWGNAGTDSWIFLEEFWGNAGINYGKIGGKFWGNARTHYRKI